MKTDEHIAARAQELLRYDPETGKMIWRVSQGRVRAGTEAGTFTSDGYHRKVQIDGRNYLAHRLAWLIVTGEWPTEEIDHISGDGLDNRWSNLREATHTVNGRNAKRYSHNTSGFTGVGWHKASRKWQANIKVNGTYIHLGCFDDLTAAVEVRKDAERQYGFHENHGRVV